MVLSIDMMEFNESLIAFLCGQVQSGGHPLKFDNGLLLSSEVQWKSNGTQQVLQVPDVQGV